MSDKPLGNITDFGSSSNGTFSETVGTPNDEQFTLEIKDVDSSVCEQLKKMKGGMTRDITCGTADANGKTTVTLKFNNNLSSTPMASDFTTESECKSAGKTWCSAKGGSGACSNSTDCCAGYDSQCCDSETGDISSTDSCTTSDDKEGTCSLGGCTRNCWLTNDCTADDAKPGESRCDGGLHISYYCRDMEYCLESGRFTLEQCRNRNSYDSYDKGFTDCRKTGKDISYCQCLIDYDKTYCDCMEEGKDKGCCECLFYSGNVMSRCYVSCKYDPEGYTGPTSAVSDGMGCYYSDENKYACGQYNAIYRCYGSSDGGWRIIGYACTDGCEDNGRHDNPDDTCKNKKKEQLI